MNDNTKLNSNPNNGLDQNKAVDDRYGAAAKAKETCLCSPVAFNTKYLEVIPKDVVDRDYGCGDPTRWVQFGDKVIDLGSGSGKNAFICSQIVGESGQVIGIDRNPNMLSLARSAAPMVAKRIGYSNVQFINGSIEALDDKGEDGNTLIPSSSIDVVLSNCVLNLVNHSSRKSLLENIKRVLNANGRIAISDIVCDKEIPIKMQQDKELWSGCISGAWQEEAFKSDFRSLGFKDIKYADRSETPWKVIEGIEFRAVTLVGHL